MSKKQIKSMEPHLNPTSNTLKGLPLPKTRTGDRVSSDIPKKTLRTRLKNTNASDSPRNFSTFPSHASFLQDSSVLV